MFTIYNDQGQVNPWEYLPSMDYQPKLGQALKLTATGYLTPCAATDRPVYICMQEGETNTRLAAVTPVIRVTEETVFETEFSVAATSIRAGDRVTLSADALNVTATKASGVAEVVNIVDGGAAGTKVRVRFPAAAAAV